MKAIRENLQLILKTLPEKPGVYRFFDENGTIIYVGKAKRLKRRVSSYFNKEHDSAKVRLLVTKIRDIQTTVVDNEWEALLLENSMIKQFKPHYNILLKDDKSYPWIAITKEEFPRIFPTRHPEPHAMQLFGPYSSVKHMNALLNTIGSMFPLRNCRRLVRNDRPCMQYQLKKCNAPCCGFVTAAEYQENIRKIIDIINGKGQGASSIHLPLQRFTLIGATTRAGQLSAPLRDRFGVVLKLELYTPEELAKIVKRSAGILGVETDEQGAMEIASRSRGTPRIANRLLKRSRDFAQVLGNGIITDATANMALEKMEIDSLGLDSIDRMLLSCMIKNYNGGPVGLETIAAAIGEESVTIEDVYEPYLMQIGFLSRTPRGRCVTPAGYRHMGIPMPGQQKLF